LFTLVCAGCRRPVAKAPPAPPATSATEESAEVDPPPKEEEEAAKAKPDETVPETTEEASDKDGQEEGEPSEEEPSEEEPGEAEETAPDEEPSAEQQPEEAVAETEPLPKERFLLLTRDGPLVIDVIMTIDEADYSLALEQVVDDALSDTDTDGDGEATWEETINNPKFAYGQFGNLIPEDEGQRRQLIEMYDNNRDGLVDREELPRFLTRNAGGSRPFSLRSSNEFRGDNRSRSPVRRLLDVDKDGAITKEEMAAAPTRLFNRDADDDEILVLADFKDTVEQIQQPQMSNRRRVNAPDTAILFTERLRWPYVSYALGETYAYGDRVSVDDVPLTPHLFKQLDENENELLDPKEIPKLAEVPPHLVIEVSFFNSAAEEGESGPRIRLASISDSLQSSVSAIREHPTRLSLDLPGAEIEFFVNDDPSLNNNAQIVSGQFAMLDADSNGYLDEEEYPGQLLGFNVEFAGVDTDGDGMIYEQELVDLLGQRQAVMRSQIRARAADQEDALLTALDANGDGRLTAREIYGAPQILASLDRNKDERLQSHEIPGTMAVGFVRGDPQRNNNLFTTPAITRRNGEEELPKWFRGMDANSDGDISPREFLGAAEQFRELDADADGFISGSEVPATDKPADDESS
jgi:Ca2+-binding EF-hand superfamily protein